MEIVVKGRHLSSDVGDSFRQHCQVKLGRLERLDHRLRRLDVELSHEPNPRLAGQCQRVEITVRTRGPVVRAEAAAADWYAAFERAFDKLEERMRRAASRRTATHSHSHHAHMPPVGGSGAPPVAGLRDSEVEIPGVPADDGVAERELDGGLLVREKQHAAAPMRIDEALHRMELVGHDFFLFADADTGQPSVVYRRRGYDYGVLRLAMQAASDAGAAPNGAAARQG